MDRRAQSLVLCEGSEVQALFNFLINFRSCIALTGPQAGIPPTILSPTVFRGATLKSNKVFSLSLIQVFQSDPVLLTPIISKKCQTPFQSHKNILVFVSIFWIAWSFPWTKIGAHCKIRHHFTRHIFSWPLQTVKSLCFLAYVQLPQSLNTIVAILFFRYKFLKHPFWI